MASIQTLSCAVLLTALSWVQAAATHAQDAPVHGRWVIAKAALAPWADSLQRGGPEEERRLVGRTVTFGPRSVIAPDPLGCARAVYRVHDDTPDLLFEGELAEPDRNGRPRDAAAQARALGMTTATVRTIETGCSEVVFHQLARDTLVFGLNDRIYTLRPAP